MSKIITQEMYEKMVEENNPYVKVIGKYTGMDNKIELKCLICGETYFANAYDAKIGKKHKKCCYKVFGRKVMKSNETFVQEMKNIQPHIQVLDEYNGAKNNLLCYCTTHHEYFYGNPDHLIHGKNGCSGCRSEKIHNALAMSHEEFVIRLNNVNQNIIVLGQYNNSSATIHVKCKKCGFEWDPAAGSLLQGNGCPHCVGRHKTTQEFKEQVYLINPYIEVIGEYIDSSTLVKCKCKKCGYIWFVNPSAITGCPKCNMSKGERKIAMFLDSHNIEYIYTKTFNNLLGVKGRNLSYDFMIKGTNILIEYQGEYHDGTARNQTDEDFEIQKEHDKRKKEYAINNGYKLLEIWYWDFENINEILENELC